MNEDVKDSSREETSPDDLRNTTNQSKVKGWLIVGASLAALMSIAYLKGRADDEEDYLKS